MIDYNREILPRKLLLVLKSYTNVSCEVYIHYKQGYDYSNTTIWFEIMHFHFACL